MAACKRPRMWTFYDPPRHDFLPKVRPLTLQHETMAEQEAERQTTAARREVLECRRAVLAELAQLRRDPA